jgi:molybdopterin/thiamine biosynthesis adenylyltransferase
MKLNLSKQTLLIPEKSLYQMNFEVFGIGSVGSNFVRTLAKSGFQNIKVYDYDVVELDNVPAQAYYLSHVGMQKTDALKQLINNETGLIIQTQEGKIEEDYDFIPSADTIYCCFFDSLPLRKMLWDKMKNYPIIWLDARIGRFDMRYYIVDLRQSDTEWKQEYEQTLENTNVSDLECGEKCTFAVNENISSRIMAQIIRLAHDKEINPIFISNLMGFNQDVARISDTYFDNEE